MSTSDRELLELAARAAGTPGKFIERMPEDGYPNYSCGVGRAGCQKLWNPLTDDGDALRMAAKLEMDICFHSEGAELLNVDPHIYTDSEDGDQMQATRRAIVQAAAEIGRSMP